MRKTIAYVCVMFLVTWCLTGCLLVSTPPGGCVDDRDCPVDTFCVSGGSCLPPGQIACEFDSDCPNTTLCDLIDGFCYFP